MNSTIDDRMTGERKLDEPHFDEEATVLARPVVPLDEVVPPDEVGAPRRPKLVLALAVAGGLIIGLLSATLIFRVLRSDQTATVEPSTVAEQPANQIPTSAGGVSESMAEVEPEPVEKENQAVVSPTDRETDPEPQVPRRPIIVTESRPQVDDDEAEEIERAMRRAARQEERRERRRTARQAKRQERQSTQQPDDLTRIREIFEGSPKP